MPDKSFLRHAAVQTQVVAAVLCWLVGCRPAEPDPAGATAVQVRSTRLREVDGVYIGLPNSLTVDDRGFFVGDAYFRQIVEFERSGEVAGVYKPNLLKGERQTYVGVPLPTDTLVLVADNNSGLFQGFRRGRKNVAVGNVSFSPRQVHPTIHTVVLNPLGEAWVGIRDTINHRAIAPWLGDSVGGFLIKHDSIGATRYIWVHFDIWKDSVAYAFSLAPKVWFGRVGLPPDSLEIPTVRRRPFNVGPMRTDWNAETNLTTRVMAMGRSTSGQIIVVHFDPVAVKQKNLSASIWVSLLSLSRRQACVDASIPVSRDGYPAVAVRRDTIFVFQQRKEADKSMSSRIDEYTLNDSTCSWIPAEAKSSWHW